MTKSIVLVTISLLIGWIGNDLSLDLRTKVFTEDEVVKEELAWGTFTIYTPEDGTSTYGTENMLTAVAEIKPGMEIHPPHQHGAEEFLFVIEGEGTWSVEGEEFEAKAGDLLYAYPWDWHGITNTGETPLRFFVVKWDNKGVLRPVKAE